MFGLQFKQTTRFVERLLELVGINWAVLDFSILCLSQCTLSVAIPLVCPRNLHYFEVELV